jgi:hypothetical protein
MPVPTSFSDLDTVAANNSPPGTESAKGNVDNYLRAAFSFSKQNYNAIQSSGFTWCGTAGGTANAITLTPVPAITTYQAGQVFRFQAQLTNAGTTTVAISGLSAIAVQVNGAACAGGEIVASQWYEGWLSSTSTMQVRACAAPNQVGAINFKRATVAATATTTPLWATANGNIQDWTGTPTITDFPAAPQAGAQREVYPAAGTIITNAGNITVQGGANYTVLAGDKLIITAISTTTFYITVQKKDGTSAGMTFASVAEMQAGTSTTATPSVSTIRQGLRVKSSIALSGSATTLLSSVPSWVTRITIVLVGCSTNGASGARVQLGDAGGLESTGYVGASSRIAGAGSVAVEVTATSGFSLYNGSDWTAALICTSKVVLELFDSANNSWHGSVYTNTTNAVGTSTTFGTKSLSQQLTTVALITADTFDGGVAYIAYE